MDFRDSPEEAAYRADLRQWLARNVPRGDTGGARGRGRYGGLDVEAWRDWSRALHDAGYVGITWPREHGGQGLGHTYEAIFLEESGRASAPPHMGVIGLGMAGPTIIAHGTPEQKAYHLPRILSAEEVFCQGFSEPDAGSDLASLRTRAERREGRYVVNGQKVWSSFAHLADWCILLTRSDPRTDDRHHGLTYLIVDMHSPGVEVRPLRQITGDPEFNEIFFTDVEVPAENLLGGEGQGWAVAMTTLLHERGTSGFALVAPLENLLRQVVELARTPLPSGRRPADDPLVRDRIARQWVELQALRYTNYRSLTTLIRTGIPGPEGSVAKLGWSESNQRLTKLALEIEGLLSQLDGEGGVREGFWQYQQLRSRGNTIEAGTSEILRNIIAERVVGLPRSH
jgi:alkylation response protein AidB-like acyl-CoA dehydrogenase